MFGFGKKKVQLKRRSGGILTNVWNALWGNTGQASNPGFYDAARTDDINRNGHFHYAEYIDAYNDPESRRQLATRAHYEASNNSTLSGAADTFAAETVGVGPSMQVVVNRSEDGDDEWGMISEELAREIEVKYNDWAKAAKLAQKKRTSKRCKVIRGESLGYFYPILVPDSAARFPNPVKLSYRAVEPARLDSIRYDFQGRHDADGFVDGIKYDAYHNPIKYRLQNDLDTAANEMATKLGVPDGGTTDIDAKYVVHSFKHEMPEQRRGVSWFASALDLSFLARQFIKSVTIAARNGARLFGFIQTNLPPDFADNVEGESCDLYLPNPGDKFELADDDIRFLPENSSVEMTTPSQPMATAPEFLKTLTNHIGRAFGMPTNVISKTSEDSNYSSGRLDYQQWDRDVAIEREQDIDEFWSLSFKLWFETAVKIEGFFTSEGADEMVTKATVTDSYPSCPRVTFRFTHRGFIDPRKETAASTERMRNGTSSLSDELAVMGKDGETVINRMAEDLGISPDEHRANIRTYLFGAPQAVPQQVTEAVENALEDAIAEKISEG